MARLKLYVVTKTPVDLDGAMQLVGAFTSEARANGAVSGAGTYNVFDVEVDKVYRQGELLDVRCIVKLSSSQLPGGAP